MDKTIQLTRSTENPKVLTVWEESVIPCSCRTDMAEHHAKGLIVGVAEISAKTDNHTRPLALKGRAWVWKE